MSIREKEVGRRGERKERKGRGQGEERERGQRKRNWDK